LYLSSSLSICCFSMYVPFCFNPSLSSLSMSSSLSIYYISIFVFLP
jgi:hypothetical protein